PSPACAREELPRLALAKERASGRARRQVFVRAVAQRHGFGALAGAEEHALALGRDELLRFEARALMAAVAKRLALGAAAGAPPIFLARGEFDRQRRSAANGWLFAHVALPASVWTHASPPAFASSRTRKI